MTVKFTNNASGTLASSVTTSSTTITLTTGQGALFPSLAVHLTTPLLLTGLGRVRALT